MKKLKVLIYRDERENEPFTNWLRSLDPVIRTRILKRVERFELGGFGDIKRSKGYQLFLRLGSFLVPDTTGSILAKMERAWLSFLPVAIRRARKKTPPRLKIIGVSTAGERNLNYEQKKIATI